MRLAAGVIREPLLLAAAPVTKIVCIEPEFDTLCGQGL